MKEYKLDKHNILGIMSGTSCDGMDFCLTSFSEQTSGYTYSITQTHSFEYSKIWKERLERAFDLSGEDLKRLEYDFTQLQIDCIREFSTIVS